MHTFSLSGLSIRQRLALLITTLLLSTILVFGFFSYIGVRKAALQVGEQRLKTSALQLGSMLSDNTRNMVATLHGMANSPEAKLLLSSRDNKRGSNVKKLLTGLKKDTAFFGCALLDSNYKPVLQVSMTRDSSLLPLETVAYLRESKTGIGEVGNLLMIDSTICYPIVAIISENNLILGYLVKWRLLKTKPSTVKQLSLLIGANASFYLGNEDGSLWTDMMHKVGGLEKIKIDSNILHYTHSGIGVLASIHKIADSRWLVSVEFTEDKLLKPATTYLYWLLAVSIVLLVGGISGAWLIARNLSRPLADLTKAASCMTSGDYATIQTRAINRFDEVGVLARSFNAMSLEVQKSRKELEKEATNYKLLFEKNPMPIWIVSTSDYNIVDVNRAALDHYGYSREEFLQLNSRNMRPAEDIGRFEESVPGLHGGDHRGRWRHKKKDGTIITVEIIANNIVYRGMPALLVLANDVTEKLKAEAELIRHRVRQQQVIAETTILVQEKEREEIGRELHDNINQVLASAKLYLEFAKNGDPNLVENAISNSYDNINLVIGEIRKLSKRLVKPSLDTSLLDALKDMTDELQSIAPLKIEFSSKQFREELVDESIKLMIYRIVQEQLNNILKHASANHVSIQLRIEGDNVHLLIKDNGVGFDITQKSKGIGLRNIDNRVRFYKGTVQIESKPGSGCAIEIFVPFKEESHQVSEVE